MNLLPIVAAAVGGAITTHYVQNDRELTKLRHQVTDIAGRVGRLGKPEPVRRNVFAGCIKLLRTGSALAGAAAVGYCVFELVRRRRNAMYNDNVLTNAGILDLIVAAEHYEPETRDCLPGESHDIVVADFEDEGESVDGSEEESDHAGASGSRRRRPSGRRVAKRKKYVHEPFKGGAVNGTYLSNVVAEARNVYGARMASEHTCALARGFMVRRMSEHGMRPAHIDAHVDRMVVAVFTITANELEARRAYSVCKAAGRIRMGLPE